MSGTREPLKTYRVTYIRSAEETAVIEIDAESIEEAERKARGLHNLERARRSTWRLSLDREDPEVDEVEEL